jgi:hypothetical protein
MTPSQLRREITNFVAELLERDLVIDYNSAILRDFSGHTYLTWASQPNFSNSTKSVPFATVAGYRYLIDTRQYNFMLYDGAIFQLFFVFRRTELVNHSLSYFPCPAEIPTDFTVTDQAISDIIDQTLYSAYESLEWLHLVRESVAGLPLSHLHPEQQGSFQLRLNMRAPIRFDFDPESSGHLHPASHVHVGHPECRIPVFAALSLGHFVRFVFMNFYNKLWAEHQFLREWPLDKHNRSLVQDDVRHLHFDCRPE